MRTLALILRQESLGMFSAKTRHANLIYHDHSDCWVENKRIKGGSRKIS